PRRRHVGSRWQAWTRVVRRRWLSCRAAAALSAPSWLGGDRPVGDGRVGVGHDAPRGGTVPVPPLGTAGPTGSVRVGSEAAHATHVVATGRGSGLLLRLVGHDGLGGEEQAGDRGSGPQGGARHLDRVGDTGREQVLERAGLGVEAVAGGQVADPLCHDAALEAGVDGDLLERGVDRDADDVRTGRLVTLQLEAVEGVLGGLDEGDATTGDDALLLGGLGVADGVLDAVLALLELDLGGRTRLDDGDAAGELGEALLELLAVVVRVGVLDLGADLLDAALDLLGVAGALDDGGLVL